MSERAFRDPEWNDQVSNVVEKCSHPDGLWLLWNSFLQLGRTQMAYATPTLTFLRNLLLEDVPEGNSLKSSN